MKKLLVFTGLSLILLSFLNLLGRFGIMNDMVSGFTWQDVDLYSVSMEFAASLALAILCLFAAGKQQRKR